MYIPKQSVVSLENIGGKTMSFDKNFKYKIHRNNKDKKSSCEKLQELTKEQQLEKIYELLDNSCTCLQCGDDDYLIVDREKDSKTISHMCLCTNCMDSVTVRINRGTFEIVSVSDVIDA